MKNSARDVEILSLEEEIRSLRQEVEKYKTLVLSISITNLLILNLRFPAQNVDALSNITTFFMLDRNSKFDFVSREGFRISH